MEYKGATIAAILIFGLLFSTAIVVFVMENPPEENGKAASSFKPVKVSGQIPAATPDVRDKDADPKFITTPSGLKYRILRKSDGVKPIPEFAVAVAYKGWTDDGKIFDQSYTKSDGYFALNSPWGVIPGWIEGLQLVGEGGMIELQIPPDLGYGQNKQGSIKANSTLHFEIEILKVIKE